MKMDWISVKERLPNQSMHVLVYPVHTFDDKSDPRVEYSWFNGEVFTLDEGWNPLDGVTHWMPLPEPPSAVEEGHHPFDAEYIRQARKHGPFDP